MAWLSDSTELVAGGWLSSAYAGHGIRGADVPSTGTHGAAILFAGLALPAENDDEFRALILTRPASLPGLVIGEDSSVDSGAAPPDGVHAGTWRGYKNGVVYGPDPSTYSITIGSAGSGVLSGGVALDGPTLGGGLQSVAPGVSQLDGGAVLGDGGAGGGLMGDYLAPPPSGHATNPRRTVRLTVIDPQEVPDLTAIEPGDTVTLAFDFSPYTTPASPVVGVARVGGDDGLAALATVGGTYVAGSLVLQRFTAPLGALGSTYRVSCTATLEDLTTQTARGQVPVRIT